MRVLWLRTNACCHHLKVQLRELGHQVDAAEDAREAGITIWVSTFRTSPSSILACRMKTAFADSRRWRSNDVGAGAGADRPRGWQDKVEVLSAGADDYVTKPFHIEEVAARHAGASAA